MGGPKTAVLTRNANKYNETVFSEWYHIVCAVEKFTLSPYDLGRLKTGDVYVCRRIGRRHEFTTALKIVGVEQSGIGTTCPICGNYIERLPNRLMSAMVNQTYHEHIEWLKKP